MIIWGSRGREKVLSSGQFYWSKVQHHEAVQIKKRWQIFHTVLHPTISKQEGGEYVECQFCHQAFKSEILDYRLPGQAAPL